MWYALIEYVWGSNEKPQTRSKRKVEEGWILVNEVDQQLEVLTKNLDDVLPPQTTQNIQRSPKRKASKPHLNLVTEREPKVKQKNRSRATLRREALEGISKPPRSQKEKVSTKLPTKRNLKRRDLQKGQPSRHIRNRTIFQPGGNAQAYH